MLHFNNPFKKPTTEQAPGQTNQESNLMKKIENAQTTEDLIQLKNSISRDSQHYRTKRFGGDNNDKVIIDISVPISPEARAIEDAIKKIKSAKSTNNEGAAPKPERPKTLQENIEDLKNLQESIDNGDIEMSGANAIRKSLLSGIGKQFLGEVGTLSNFNDLLLALDADFTIQKGDKTQTNKEIKQIAQFMLNSDNMEQARVLSANIISGTIRQVVIRLTENALQLKEARDSIQNNDLHMVA